MSDLERALNLGLRLLRKAWDKVRLNTALQDVHLLYLLLLLTQLITEQHQAIGDGADGVADSSLAFINEPKERVQVLQTLLSEEVGVFDHYYVLFKAFSAVAEAFGHLIEPGDTGLVRAHEQVEREDDALEAIFLTKESID